MTDDPHPPDEHDEPQVQLADGRRRWLDRASRGTLVVGGALVAVVVALVVLGSTGTLHSTLRAFGLASNAAPANDDVANAQPVAGGAFSGSTSGATTETWEPGQTGVAAGAQTVWFQWTAPQSGPAYLTPDDAGDTSVTVWSGSVGTGTPALVSAALPTDGGNTPSPTAPVVAAVGGQTYWFQVSSPANGGGAFSYTLAQPDGPAPANDDFSPATSLAAALGSVTSGNSSTAAVGWTAGATAEAGEPGIGGQPAAHSVWYSLTPPASASASVTVTVAAADGGPGGLRLGTFTGPDAANLTVLATGANDTLTIPGGTPGPVAISVDGPEQYFTLTLAESNITPADTTPPTVACTPPTGWTTTGAVPCTASDPVGLANPAQASFTLTPSVPAGDADAQAVTSTATVCDTLSNCTTVGPYTVEVDQAAPVVDCPPTPSGWQAANVSVTCTVADQGSGLASGTPTSVTLATTVAAGQSSASAAFTATPAVTQVCDVVGNCTPMPTQAAAEVDLAAPTVSCGTAPAGWQGQNVAVACTATDAGSGLADPKDDGSFTLSTTVSTAQGDVDADASTGTLQVCDVVGNCTTAGPITGIEVDLAPPTISCTAPTGWADGTSASVPCTATLPDPGPALAVPADASFSLTATIAAGTENADVSTGTLQVCDTAGVCATAGPITGVELDDAPPTITCGATPTGWQQGPSVSVNCSAADAGSGLAHTTDAAFTLTASVPTGTESASATFGSRQVCDAVGNCATTPGLATVEIDDQAPVVSCGSPPGGVQAQEVSVACTATDAGSGLADPADASFSLSTSVPAGTSDPTAQTATRQVCDGVGNCTTAGPFTADVDLSQQPASGAPALDLPGQVGVLAAVTAPAGGPVTSVTVPYALPATSGGVGKVTESCAPDPGGVFPIGETPVQCGASDQALQQTNGVFYVSVALASQLAPTGPATQGKLWRAVGVDFAPDSPVTVELDGAVVDHATTDASGSVSDVFTIPADAQLGSATMVVRGTDPSGNPLLVVTPMAIQDVGNGYVAPTTTTTTTPTTTTTTPTNPSGGVKGYYEVASDGGIFAFDAPFLGSAGNLTLNKPVVGMTVSPSGRGYWFVASDGGIFNYGDAGFYGSAGSLVLNQPIVAMAATPDGKGYWLVASDGGIFNYGDAGFYGSMGGHRLNQPIVGMAATPSGKGYWLVASDGGIFAFGDAGFEGSMGNQHLNQPIVAMAAAPGGGYYELASDGGLFAFGGAPFEGSMGGQALNAPIVGMTVDPRGGYYEVASDGGLFAFGGAPFEGSMGNQHLNQPIVGMADAVVLTPSDLRHQDHGATSHPAAGATRPAAGTAPTTSPHPTSGSAPPITVAPTAGTHPASGAGGVESGAPTLPATSIAPPPAAPASYTSRPGKSGSALGPLHGGGSAVPWGWLVGLGLLAVAVAAGLWMLRRRRRPVAGIPSDDDQPPAA